MYKGRQKGSKNKKPSAGKCTNGVGVGLPLPMEEAYLPPTKSDYKETTLLFRDFEIFSISIPAFQTRNSLFHWRTRIIQAALS